MFDEVAAGGGSDSLHAMNQIKSKASANDPINIQYTSVQTTAKH